MSKTQKFIYRSVFPCTARELYDFHSRPGALERLLPPWDGSEVVWKKGSLAPGGKVLMKLKQGPISFPWEAHHIEEIPGVMFQDVQHKGPFAQFSHVHRFSDTPEGALLEDEIEFALPFQSLMPAIATRQVYKMLTSIFTYREHTLTEDLKLHARCSKKPLRILISGASGVLGSVLVPLLTTGGHEVWTLVRRRADPHKNEIQWDPQNEILDLSSLPDLDGVIHLAGEYIGLGRWSPAKKRSVIESRTRGTHLLASAIAALPKKPDVFLSASAVGYYGDCGPQIIYEDHPEGNDFISEVCSLWEGAAAPAKEAGIRTVLMRLGVALTPRGGALQRLLVTTPLGFFKRFGIGNQYISWMSIDDMVSAMLHCLVTPAIEGPINIAAPEPVTNIELLQTLAKTSSLPQALDIPAWFLKILYGQMATEILLSGCRVSSGKLKESGFTFRHPTLPEALQTLLGKLENNQTNT
ncbi:TIGR01777 family oxidoreductase [Desulfosediminicola flagellatus]|uniref:TIGR01777 family oxidoreductase n=1 Tax=Desulfosediminicola flagellatus TaxID=2569541 RepID=UPI0010AD2DBF|nr:TIGR01777 family oxidoreductase [Desulfosediminicola flagellatus]